MLAEILGPDLLIVLLIAIVLFGGSQLPKLARSLGSAKSEFEKGLGDVTHPTKPQDEPVTMTRAELDTMLAEREAQARKREGSQLQSDGQINLGNTGVGSPNNGGKQP
ncbi:MAG: Sec-independent protein translocase subunit TatA/TatB [Acidimicrobiales bacterium]